jgi:hypothetical protein
MKLRMPPLNLRLSDRHLALLGVGFGALSAVITVLMTLWGAHANRELTAETGEFDRASVHLFLGQQEATPRRIELVFLYPEGCEPNLLFVESLAGFSTPAPLRRPTWN